MQWKVSKPRNVKETLGYAFSPFSPLETISTLLWASPYHHSPVLSVFNRLSHFFHIFPCVVEPSPSRPPHILFHATNMSIIFLERFSSSLLLRCPYQFHLFSLKNVDIRYKYFGIILYDLVFEKVLSGLPLIHHSILISAACNLFSSVYLVFQLDAYLFCRIAHLSVVFISSKLVSPGC